jgi:iron complex outermembrane receptor protein
MAIRARNRTTSDIDQQNQNKLPEFRRSALSLAIALALPGAMMMSGAALAQSSLDEESEVGDGSGEMVMEEIVVTGKFRASLIDAIGTKRASTSIIEAISAEDIGKLPDPSIANSLARMPGVSGERRNGRVSGISVRGFNENYVGTTMNGRELLGMGDNRGVEYDLYPAEIVSGMVVYKTPDATQTVQGIGGIVDLRTNRPLENERYLVVNGTYEKNGQDSANPDFSDSGYRLALSWSDVFADETIGVSLVAAHLDSPTQEEYFRGWGYPGVNADNAGPGVSLSGDEAILGGHDSYARSAQLKRDTISGVIQWAPNDDLTVTLDGLYIDFQEDQVFRGLEEGLAEWGSGEYTVTGVEPGFVTDVDFTGGFRSVIRNDAERKKAKLKTFGLNIDYQMGDNWNMAFDAATSKVDKTITNVESYSGVGRAGLASQGPATTRSWVMTPEGAVFSPLGSSPDLTDFNLVRLAGPQAWGGAMAPLEQFAEVTLPDGSVIGPPQSQDGFVNQPVFEEKLTTLRLEASRLLDLSIMKEITFGVNYSDRSKSKDNGGFFLTAPTWPLDGPIPEEFREGTTSLDFIGIDGVVAYDSIRMFDEGYYIASDAQLLETKRFGDTYEIDEKLTTLFAKLDFDTDLGQGMLYGNVGLQYLHVDQSSDGFGAQTGPDLFVQATPISGGDDYNEWLPSLNVNYDFNNGHVVRLAASKTVSRPRMDDMRSNQVVSFFFNLANVTSTDPQQSAWSGSAGNPALRPLEANQFDIAWDWYFAQDGFVSAAYFYKDLVNWHRSGSFVADFSEFFIPGYHQVDDENGNPVTPATMEGLVSFREDGLKGSVNGYEFQATFPFRVLWAPLDGFGMIATATFIDGKLDDGTRVPGLSDENYGLTLYYERGGFEIRGAATKRTKYLTETRGESLSLVSTFDQGATLLDAQISYDFGWDGRSDWLGGLSLALQGQNLTNEDTIQTNDDARQVTLYQKFGANYLFTAIYRFW